MHLEVESAVPYQDSLLWEWHRRYYQESGAEVFFKQEVPYNISSNRCYAEQVFALFQAVLPDDQEIVIVELGAGLGLFALNLLQLWSERAPQQFSRLRYLLTDYARPTLDLLATHPAFSTWISSGRLEIALLDGSQPLVYTTLTGETLPLGQVDGLIANYVLSTLPTAVLIKQPQAWYQQTTALYWQAFVGDDAEAQWAWQKQVAQALRQADLLATLASDHPQRFLFEGLSQAQVHVAEQLETVLLSPNTEWRQFLLDALGKAWENAIGQSLPEAFRLVLGPALIDAFLFPSGFPADELQTQHSLEQIELQAFCHSSVHQQAIETLSADFVLATLSYPYLALSALEQLRPLLKTHALLVVSDKAYPDPQWWEGARAEEATRHGGSLAHPVNFPLMAEILRAQGYGVSFTHDSAFALHTLVASLKAHPKLISAFDAHFLQHPGNEISHALLEGGHALLRQECIEQAWRAFSKALSYRPNDGTLQYLQAVCLLNQCRYTEAITLLRQPHDDIYGLLNREILLAEALRLLEQYDAAIPHYLASLNYGENSQTYYNLALCYIEKNEVSAAQQMLEAAANLDPADLEVQQTLLQISS